MTKNFNNFAQKHLNVNSLALHQYQNKINTFIPTSMTPNVLEERHMNVAIMSVFDRLMSDRIIFLGTLIDDVIANIVNAQLLFLESVDPNKDIQLYLNTPGGSVLSGLSIVDVMNYIKPDVSTVCAGMAASMGAILLSSGAKGKRQALPHSRVMIHQPLGGASGQASDIEITHKQIQILKKELYVILAETSSQTYKKIETLCDRDYWMTSEEAKEFGFIDNVIGR